ncbi:MAG: tetratricopeptide repeat protein [Bacteroidales bacterium]|nr:tetratricopeptide repeat protein [Bacteroidales bacterium]
MKKILTFFLVSMFSFGLIFGQSARRYFKTGEDFYEVKKYKDAIEQFSKAVELDPDYDDAYLLRAASYEYLDQYEKAAQDYERALVFNEKDEEIHYMAGNAYYMSGQYGAALSKLNDALVRKSKYPEALQVRIKVFLALKRYDAALADCKAALNMKQDEVNYYNLGLVYEKLELYTEAEDAYKKSIAINRNVLVSQLALAKLAYKLEKYDLSMAAVNQALRISAQHKEGLKLRSQIYAAQMNLSKAIDDISLALKMYPGDPELHILRGDFYQQLSRHSDAIVDYTYALEADTAAPSDLFFKRARSYEFVRNYEAAMADYDRLLERSKYDGDAQRLLAEAKERMFEINREEDAPVVKLLDPVSNEDNSINVPKGTDVIPLIGFIEDESEITALKVNDFTVQPTEDKEGYKFLASVNLRNTDEILVEATDVYNNKQEAVFKVLRTETESPEVRIMTPYASDNNLIYLDSNEPVIYVEGKINDDSQIKSIYIDDVMASYSPNSLNPVFSARVRVENRNRFTVKAEDVYGNIADVEFTIEREVMDITNNPMGRTWAIFIENSNYEAFPSLEGPTRDIMMMKSVLAKYQIHNYIHKKDMSNSDMSRFFQIELRDLLRSNRVSSILIWYAGHGKFQNETGYWIPVDAVRDDEFTYFSINNLKAYMQSYPENVTHTLVVTDACESGPSFYQAMRSANDAPSCDNWEATRFKSSQVLSSAGYELASDDSQFTRTFANTLDNNPDACIPIESVVQKVTDAVTSNNQQKPQFGKIAGLEDENGTFFFIPKEY